MTTAENDGEGQQEELNELEQQGEGSEGEQLEENGNLEGTSSEDDEQVHITIGEESPPQNEEDELELTPAAKTAWFHMRRAKKEQEQKIRELEQQVAARAAPSAPATLGAKPSLEGCDFDTDRFETELTTWHERKRAVDEQTAKQQKEQEDAQKAWQTKLDGYNMAKASLKVPDFEDAEAVVLESMTATQQSIIVSGADTPANVIYALGKNPAKAKELASIKDPVKFAFAVAKLETQLKVTPRKAPPAPEKVVRGSAAAVGVTNPKLDRLEAEADATGDRSKFIAYQKQLKAAKAA